MLRKIRKFKFIVAFFMVFGLVLVTANHSMAMNMTMDPLDCMTKKMCADCTIPEFSDVPDFTPSFELFNLVPGLAVQFPDTVPTLFYHPPR